MKVPVSIIVPVRNEVVNLPRALSSVRWADEVWVVDSASTDGTAAMAGSLGARVVQFPFNGVWPKKKNWALENIPFRHDWVFILDADEVLPPEAGEEIRAIVTAAEPPADGYWIDRRLNFMGRWLRHAYRPNWNLRLFRHRLGRYERLASGATASGDNEVHEHVIVRGRTGRLSCVMDHYAFPSIEVFVEKHNRYSNWEACVEVRGGGGESRPQLGRVGWRRRLRTLSRSLPARPFLRFCYVYFWQRGFLDGRPGYYLARLHAFYELLSVAKAHELRRCMAAEAARPPVAPPPPAAATPARRPPERILGVDFFTGSLSDACRRAWEGGLLLAPSGPGLAGDLVSEPAYRAALASGDIILADSGFVVTLWRLFAGRTLPRHSGLAFLREFLRSDGAREPGALFWVMPSERDLRRNAAWLRGEGIPADDAACWVAPHYPPGPVEDRGLLALLESRRPRIIVIAIGGGTQEILGHYLKARLSYRPGILCLGAAVAFLSGAQVRIPPWVDFCRLGWLWRTASSPRLYFPRYWRTIRLARLVWRHGAEAPAALVPSAAVPRRP